MGRLEHVTSDMRMSIRMVEKYRAELLRLVHADDIMRVEGEDNDVLKMLDASGGVDYYQIAMDGRLLGVASRWQIATNGNPFNTFTVRKSRESGARTEYEKRKLAIEKGGEYPFLTIHGYVDTEERLLTIGAARTADIIECIDSGICGTNHTRPDKHGQAEFYYVPWETMLDNGYQVNRVTRTYR